MATPDLPPTEQLASKFVASELAAARVSLRRTRIGCAIAVLFVASYLSVLIVVLQTHLLRAQPAAQLTTHYASQLVQQNGQDVSAYLLKEVPAFIHDLPDQLITRLPALRLELETQTERLLEAHMRDLTTQLGGSLNSFLTEHQQDVKDFLQLSKDPQFAIAFGDNLERELNRVLQTKTKDGKSVNDCLAEGLSIVRSVEARLDRLAHASDLTPEEKRLRRIVAITIKLTDQATQAKHPALSKS